MKFFNLTINILLVPSFEIAADIFVRPSVFDSHEGLSNILRLAKMSARTSKEGNNIGLLKVHDGL